MKNMESFWDKMAGKQDNDVKRFAALQSWMLEKSKKYLNKKQRVLDFGCGTGSKTLPTIPYVKEILGIDISMKAIAIAKSKVKGSLPVEFKTVSLFDSSLKEGSFDCILAYNILHAVPDMNASLKRLHSLLKSDGTLITSTACLGEKMSTLTRLQFLLYQIASFCKLIPLHIALLTFEDLRAKIGDGGFTILEAESKFDKLSILFIAANKLQRSMK